MRYAPAPAGTSTIALSCHTSGWTLPHTCDTRRQHVCSWHAHSNDSINVIACHCSLSVEALYIMHLPAAKPCWALPPQVNRRPLRHSSNIVDTAGTVMLAWHCGKIAHMCTHEMQTCRVYEEVLNMSMHCASPSPSLGSPAESTGGPCHTLRMSTRHNYNTAKLCNKMQQN